MIHKTCRWTDRSSPYGETGRGLTNDKDMRLTKKQRPLCCYFLLILWLQVIVIMLAKKTALILMGILIKQTNS